jgi:uncharacterized protein with ParB-like and HNH nuclease domain
MISSNHLLVIILVNIIILLNIIFPSIHRVMYTHFMLKLLHPIKDFLQSKFLLTFIFFLLHMNYTQSSFKRNSFVHDDMLFSFPFVFLFISNIVDFNMIRFFLSFEGNKNSVEQQYFTKGIINDEMSV